MGKFVQKKGKDKQGNDIYSVKSPVGALEYVMISGQGVLNKLKNDDDAYEYKATLVLDSESDECKQFIEELNEVWEECKTKKFAKKDPRSMGFRPHTIRNGEDEDGDPHYEPTGNTAFQFKTNTTFADGNTKKVSVFNAKGKEVQLGTKRVGNESRGRIEGIAKYYQQPSDAGVSLYLNAVQLSKFVEFTGGPDFDEIEEEDAFEGFDEDGMEALEEGSNESSGDQPRL